ncbi:MAG: GGDEF domain-containing protein [Oscillospiraceae bacterium]|nr:GGDEF domain-containing protein [Oscillospiraceae bacterium]
MNIIATVADIVSAAYLLVIIIGIYHIRSEENTNTRAYKSCVWICFSALVIDAAAFVLRGPGKADLPVWISNYFAYVLFDYLTAAYGIYMFSYIRARKKSSSAVFLWIILIICLLDIIFYTVGVPLGKIFSVENGMLITGPWETYITVAPALSLIVFIAWLLINIRVLGTADLIILSTFNIMQLVTSVIWLLHPNLVSSYIGYALALSVIFVMIQFRTISESSLKAEISDALSVRDALTGLKNRRAYGECLSAVAPDARVTAVFCDVNSLKTVNDTLGHEAGDRMIQKMADILKEIFTDDEVFRISGDEFVAVLQNKDEKSVSEKLDTLKRRISDNDRIAAVGFRTGEGANIMQLIQQAEQMMYADKRRYYIETGKDRRTMGAAPELPEPVYSC